MDSSPQNEPAFFMANTMRKAAKWYEDLSPEEKAAFNQEMKDLAESAREKTRQTIAEMDAARHKATETIEKATKSSPPQSISTMKSKIVFSLLLLVGWGWFTRGIVAPVSTIAKNTAVVATVNGGDDAFVAQSALHQTFQYGSLISAAIVLTILLLIWHKPISSLFSGNQPK